jgi:DNA-binding CsgD family transcriptional regulator
MHASLGSIDRTPPVPPGRTSPRARRRRPTEGALTVAASAPVAAVGTATTAGTATTSARRGLRCAPAVALDWPFLGRDDELQILHDLVTDGGRSGVVLAGPMGVGKTRLAHEALARAEQAGLATVRIAATRAAATLPFGALAPLIGAHDLPPGVSGDRAWLLRRSTETLLARAGGRPLVMLVDDAHLLDWASAALVHQVAAAGTAFVLATVRTDEPTSDLVVGLWKDGLADRVELDGLPDDTIAELVAAAVGGPVEGDAVAKLAARSQGNVLFLRELVTGAVSDGSLGDDGGRWRLRGALTPSNRLIELVESRLGRLTRPERDLLELVSVGEPLGHAELASLGEPALAETLERRGFLATATDGRRLEVRLAHPVYGDVVRARISALRERAVTRALADAVESAGARRREDALRVAGWRLTGGGGTPEVLLAGATAARWHYDYPLAERLARAALDLGAGFDAALLAAQLAGLRGRVGDAERELAALASRAADDRQRGLVALARTDNSVTSTGADDAGILDQAEATIADPAWRDQLAARRIGVLLHHRGPRAAAAAAEPLLRRGEGALPGEAFVVACISGGYGLNRLGRLDEALEVAARGHAVQLASPTTLTWYTWWHEVTRCHALTYAGRFDEAATLAAANYRQALDEGSTEAQAAFALLPAFAVCERGRVRTAARLAREAAALNDQLGRPTQVAIAHVYAAFALALAGQAREAEETLAALDALPATVPRQHEADLLRARGWAAAAAGRLPEAHRHLELAAAVADEIGDRVGAVSALTGLARLGRADDVRHSLADIARGVDGELAPARVAFVDALADHDAARLEAASHRFEAMGADLLAAEAVAEAAVVRRRAGETRPATADRRRAAALAERCEGAVTPALRGIEARAALTPAERETALLAAAGLSSRRIAGELVLSVRTVENRLQRVYEKLGISGRADLPDALS